MYYVLNTVGGSNVLRIRNLLFGDSRETAHAYPEDAMRLGGGSTALLVLLDHATNKFKKVRCGVRSWPTGRAPDDSSGPGGMDTAQLEISTVGPCRHSVGTWVRAMQYLLFRDSHMWVNP